MTWDEVLAIIPQCGLFGDDWDGLGSLAPCPEMVNTAFILARELQDADAPPPTRVCLGVNATIFLEWQIQKGYLEIEVVSGEKAECFWLSYGAKRAEVCDIHFAMREFEVIQDPADDCCLQTRRLAERDRAIATQLWIDTVFRGGRGSGGGSGGGTTSRSSGILLLAGNGEWLRFPPKEAT